VEGGCKEESGGREGVRRGVEGGCEGESGGREGIGRSGGMEGVQREGDTFSGELSKMSHIHMN